MKIPFYKCNGNGNSFIILLQNNSFKKKISKNTIQTLCNSNNKDVDGCLTINYTTDLIIVNYYNNDGSWETFCLNGLRCVALIMYKILNKNNILIIMNNISYKVRIESDSLVSVELSKPLYKMNNIKINNISGDFIDSGAKHFVCNYKGDWNNYNTINQMKEIRFNELFKPYGINVNYYKVINNNCIAVKTYEKGIEKIMDSCASGSYACAFDYSFKNNIYGKIKVLNDGGICQITFNNSYEKNLFSAKAEIESKGMVEI